MPGYRREHNGGGLLNKHHAHQINCARQPGIEYVSNIFKNTNKQKKALQNYAACVRKALYRPGSKR
jgi:hypothetical protein